MMDLEELFEKGLLKEVAASKERAEKSLDAGDNYLKEARKALGADALYLAFIGAYNSAFHYARAVLFLDGVTERSHFAVSRYLQIKKPELGDELNTLDIYRNMRHSAQYGLDAQTTRKEVEDAIRFAFEFGTKIKRMTREKRE